MTEQLQLKDPKSPTKKYIASLLRSEDIIPNTEPVEQCLDGWIDATKDSLAIRVQNTRSLQKSFTAGDCWAIGYCSYTYHIWPSMKSVPKGE